MIWAPSVPAIYDRIDNDVSGRGGDTVEARSPACRSTFATGWTWSTSICRKRSAAATDSDHTRNTFQVGAAHKCADCFVRQKDQHPSSVFFVSNTR